MVVTVLTLRESCESDFKRMKYVSGAGPAMLSGRCCSNRVLVDLNLNPICIQILVELYSWLRWRSCFVFIIKGRLTAAARRRAGRSRRRGRKWWRKPAARWQGERKTRSWRAAGAWLCLVVAGAQVVVLAEVDRRGEKGEERWREDENLGAAIIVWMGDVVAREEREGRGVGLQWLVREERKLRGERKIWEFFFLGFLL